VLFESGDFWSAKIKIPVASDDGQLPVMMFEWSIKPLTAQNKTRGWQLKYFLFSPRKFGGDEPILTSIFFRWVGSTTN